MTTGLSAGLARIWESPDDARVVQYDGRWYTCSEIRGLADAIDACLASLGAGSASRVGVVLANRPASYAALLAILARGRCLVTLSPLQPAIRLARDIRATAPRVLLLTPATSQLPEVREAIADLGATAIVLEDGALGAVVAGTAAIDTAEGIAVEMLTSGTTGSPKRIPLSYEQIEASLSSALQAMRGSRDDTPPFSGKPALVTLPIVHIGGLWALLQSLVETRPTVLLARFSVAAWTAAVREHRPKIVGLPPAAMREVLDQGVDPTDLASLRAITSGTSPLDPALADAFTARYDIPILSVYGATEFSGAVAGWSLPEHHRSWSAKRGSVGKAFPGVELRVVDPEGHDVGPDGEGQLEVRSKQVRGGDWVRTTDLARLDAEGFLFILGRADDVIIRGGFKVSPQTVAGVLEQHPAVLGAGVAGLPDARLGQVPVAAVELSGAVTPDELRAFCRERLTPYEVPTRVIVVDKLPRGVSYKVDRTALVELLNSYMIAPNRHEAQEPLHAT